MVRKVQSQVKTSCLLTHRATKFLKLCLYKVNVVQELKPPVLSIASLDFFTWETLKNKVFKVPSENNDQLKQRIVMENITYYTSDTEESLQTSISFDM